MFAKATSFFSKHFWKILILVTGPIILFGIFFLTLRHKISETCPEEVVLVNAIFGPGDRALVKLNAQNHGIQTFNLPFTLFNDLSKKGVVREAKLGTYLQNRYNVLLNGNMSSGNFKAYSGTGRWNTKSLSLVLNSLLPGRKEAQRKVLKEQQSRETPEFVEKMFNAWNCSNYDEYFHKYLTSKQVQARIRQDRNRLAYLSEHSGYNITSFLPALAIYLKLRAAENEGLDLPSWTNPVYPEILENLALEELKLRGGTDDLRKFAAGYLLQQLVIDFKAKINDTSDKKIILYSTDEYNIGEILIALGVFEPKYPNYSSCIMLELRRIQGSYFVKIFYETDLDKDPVLLKLPGCKELCPFEKFEIEVQKYFPAEDFCALDYPVEIDLVIWDLDDFLEDM